MSRPPEYAILGGGVIGVATAWALADQGVTTRVFDRFGPANAHGGSHGATRLFRLAYFEHPNYVPLLKDALNDWRTLRHADGAPVFHQSGVIYFGDAEGALIKGISRSAAHHNLSLEIDVAKRDHELQILLRPPQDMVSVLEPVAGYIEAERAVEAFIHHATQSGAAFHWREPATALERHENKLTVVTRKDRYQVDRLILAPGAFAADVFDALELTLPCPITPIEKVLCWQAPGISALHVSNGAIPFVVEHSDGEIFYGFPAIDEEGVKVGRHGGGRPLSTASVRRYANQEEADAICAFLNATAKEKALYAKNGKRTSCLYAMSPDGSFVLDRLCEDPRIIYGIGFSGHGFKFAPAIGRSLAALALDRQPAQDVGFLSPSRFNA